MKKDRANYIVFLIIIFIFLLPIIQLYTSVVHEKKLNGYLPGIDTPSFTFSGWFDESYQTAQENYQKRNVGFQPTLVRINSQFNYSLFRIIKAATIVEGKEGHKFAMQYMDSYLGTDYLGNEKISEKVRKLALITDTLETKGVTIIVILAPGKGMFHPEYIPDSYVKKPPDTTNYQVYLKHMSATHINLIDMAAYYLGMKDTSRYVLFPKNGIHWSIYGNTYVGDSILKYIEDIRQTKLQELKVTKLKITNRPRGSDRDVEDAINLIFPLKEKRMAYPLLEVDTTGAKKQLNVLAIGDSFYWVIYSMGYSSVFENHNFWFYYNEVFPKTAEGKVLDAKKLNLREEIESRDVIILYVNDAKLKEFAWDFIEDVFQIYYPSY